MAKKSKDKKKGSSREKLAVRRVATREDRKRPSVFMHLKTDEQFVGIPLFEPNPELDDNPGFFEYYTHWDQRVKQNVPCSGDTCTFCAQNDSPSTRALTVWYFPENGKGEQIKVFGANYSTVEALADEAEDEGGIMGRTVRIKRISDKGEYRVKIRAGKAISKSELKKLLKLLAEFDLEKMVNKQLKSQVERIKAQDALEEEDDFDDDDADDDDDEEEEDEPKKGKDKKKGKGKKKDDDEDESEDEEDDDDDEDDEDDDDEDEPDEEDDDDEDSDDDEDDDSDDDDDEDSDDEEEGEETPSMSGKFTVTKTDEDNNIVHAKDAKGKSHKMWVGEGVEVDFEAVKKGTVATLTALQDEEGDWIISEWKVGKKKK